MNCYQEEEMAVARLSQLKAIIDVLKDQEEPIISVDPTSKQYQLCPINDCRQMKSVKKVNELTRYPLYFFYLADFLSALYI